MAFPRFQARRRLFFISHRGKNVPATEEAKTFNNKSGVGSPVGVVTPDVAEQFYRDTSGIGLWQSTGLTSNDWIRWI